MIFIPTYFDPQGFPDVPLEFCPGIVVTFVLQATLPTGVYTCPIAHVLTPDKGLEAYLYPMDNEFALNECHKMANKTEYERKISCQ